MMEITGTGALGQLANDLVLTPARTENQARGVAAKALDAAAADARSRALSTWTRYGRGMRGSAGTIRARMSNSEKTVGYLFADGPGAFMQERGTGHHPPQPVMSESVMGMLDGLAKNLSEVRVL